MEDEGLLDEPVKAPYDDMWSTNPLPTQPEVTMPGELPQNIGPGNYPKAGFPMVRPHVLR